MILLDSLPGFKSFLGKAALPAHAFAHVVSFVAAFLLHHGPMSATTAACLRRCHRRHVATLTRFLAECGQSNDLLQCARCATLLLERQANAEGGWVFLVDSTLRHSLTALLENTCCYANHQPRHGKKRVKSKQKRRQAAPRRSHTFVFGLLLTPGGLRLPYWLPYYTQEHAQQIDRPFLTQAQLAAQLIGGLELPAGAEVVVVGDTAFEAAEVRAACRRRGWGWVLPMNPGRVLAGNKGSRRPVLSLQQEMSASSFEPVRLHLDRDRHRLHRRVSVGRVGPGTDPKRTYWVCRRTAEVHHIGTVVVLFSNKRQVKPGEAVDADKVLLSNVFEAATQQLVAWYDLRWQIELFFRELKSVLGMVRYRVGKFVRAKGWVELCCVAFCYLEWLRGRELARPGLGQKQRQDWERARAGRLCQLLRQRLERDEVQRLYRWSKTPSGLRRLRHFLREACEDASHQKGVA